MVSAVVASQKDWQINECYQVYTKALEKPANDEREYRLVKLLNQLEVLIISDPDTDRASAALDVHVGSLNDPHIFCEHLLFMGTKKYPKENDYYSYLSEHSGLANAFTGTENTNYFFEVGHQFLEGALDRFSHFFIDPLFSESCTERELRAVDSEHKKNLQSDCWRIAQVEKQLSNPNHPWHLFENGKLGLDIRQELLKFHETYYSANIMKLTVIGKESLDQLTEWVVEKFSNVINRNILVPSFEGHPLTENQTKKQIFIKSVKKTRTLSVTFPFPDQAPFYESQPAHYLSHLTGHEGPGSILSYLKKKNWATYLSSGMCFGGTGFGFFHVCVDLTEQGIVHYEDVVVAIFQYIEMLKESGPKQWIFDEIKSLAEIEFRFSEKCTPSQYASYLSQQMQENLPPHQTISGSHILRKYDPKLINQHLELLRPDNFRLMLAAQEFPHGIQLTKVEKWYSTDYEELGLRPELMNRLENISLNDEFTLPAINEFLPSNLDVSKFEVTEKKTEPELIEDTPLARIWYKQDDTFWAPRTNVWIMFKNPLLYATPRNSVMTKLYMSLLTDSLSEYSYNAEVAGLAYYVDQELQGIILNVGGYSDKLPLLLAKVIDKMKNIRIEQERFDILKEELTRGYEKLLFRGTISTCSLLFVGYPVNCGYFNGRLPLRDLDDVNSAINYNTQICDVKDIGLRNRLALVSAISQEPCFNQLRTREQLGYLVFSGVRRQLSQLAFRLIVQSERDPIYLENRVLEFLESLREIIAEMPETEYQSQVDSLIADNLEKHKNLYDEGSKYWSDIECGYYEFNDTVKDVEELKTITKESLLEFYDELIMPSSNKVSAISVHETDRYNVDQLYPVLTYLKLVDKKELSEDDLKEKITENGGDSKIQNETGFVEFLSTELELNQEQINQVIIKMNQGPSGLSSRDHTALPKDCVVIKNIFKFKRRLPLSVAAVPFYKFTNV
ncbi:Metalloenzyme, LuxS/M16 peptidase-like protein [Pilaira anomala]|nr:Metalloenzyme, LuxS/M16 peptidase-like protein [Pilaira anomala]